MQLLVHGSADKLTWSGITSTHSDRSGNTITYVRDTYRYLSEMTDTLGGVTNLSYTVGSPASNKYLSQMTDPAGRSYLYGWNGAHQLTSYTDPMNHVTAYGYDSGGRLSQITDPNGNITNIVYDSSGRVSTITRVTDVSAGTGPTTTITYGSGTAGVRDSNNHLWTYTLTNGMITAIADPASTTTQVTRSSDLQTSQVTPPSQYTTTATYDASGEWATGATSASGATTGTSYVAVNGTQLPQTVTDAQGNQTKYQYDSVGRVTAVTQVTNLTTGTGPTTTYTYGQSDGDLLTKTDANNHTTTYTCGTNKLPATVQPPAPLGATQYTGYDSAHRNTSVVDGAGNEVDYQYDALDRVTLTTYNTGNGANKIPRLVIANTYDNADNRTQETDNQYDSTGTTVISTTTCSWHFNALNQLTEEDSPSNSAITYT